MTAKNSKASLFLAQNAIPFEQALHTKRQSVMSITLGDKRIKTADMAARDIVDLVIQYQHGEGIIKDASASESMAIQNDYVHADACKTQNSMRTYAKTTYMEGDVIAQLQHELNRKAKLYIKNWIDWEIENSQVNKNQFIKNLILRFGYTRQVLEMIESLDWNDSRLYRMESIQEVEIYILPYTKKIVDVASKKWDEIRGN